MHPRAAEFCERAAEEYGLSLAADVDEFPDGTETAADAADAVGCELAQIASSIVVDVDGELVVAVTSGANRVDVDAVANHVGAPAGAAGMADADRIRESIGWSIGGVPPLCHDADVPTLFDPQLTEYDTIWAAAGTPTTVFSIAPDELVAHADATVVDVTE